MVESNSLMDSNPRARTCICGGPGGVDQGLSDFSLKTLYWLNCVCEICTYITQNKVRFCMQPLPKCK